jgi:hypothetical protein
LEKLAPPLVATVDGLEEELVDAGRGVDGRALLEPARRAGAVDPQLTEADRRLGLILVG